ncbi:MAG: NUDIX domain-containing protein [Spirochaetes bacterium]|nr:NUDIX domain-containing protein [Spirochaetota bacterium]
MHYSYCPVCGKKIEKWDDQLIICSSCGYHFYQTSKPTAGAVIIRETGSGNGKYQVLLTRRGIEPFKGYWDIPGGFLRNGEEPEEGLRREIREELGIDILKLRLFHAVTDRYPRDDIPEEANYTLCLYFLCTIDDSKKLKAEDDITESEWFSLDSLPFDLSFKENKKTLDKVRRYLPEKGIDF